MQGCNAKAEVQYREPFNISGTSKAATFGTDTHRIDMMAPAMLTYEYMNPNEPMARRAFGRLRKEPMSRADFIPGRTGLLGALGRLIAHLEKRMTGRR
jgi:hypothetical protein